LLRGALLYSLPRGALGYALLRGVGGDALLRRVALHALVLGEAADALLQDALLDALLGGTLRDSPQRQGIAAAHPRQGPELRAVPLRRAFGDLLRPAFILARGGVLDPTWWVLEFAGLWAPGRAGWEALGRLLFLGAADFAGLETLRCAQLQAGLPAGKQASGVARLRVQQDTLLSVGLTRQQRCLGPTWLRVDVRERLRVALPSRHRALDHAHRVARGTARFGLGRALLDAFSATARSRQVQVFVPLPVVVHGSAKCLCLKEAGERQAVHTGIA